MDTDVDKCRQMQTSVDESRKVFFNSRKCDTWPHSVVAVIMQQ